MVATTSAPALRARFEVKVATLIVALFLAPVASAHHSVAAEFDTASARSSKARSPRSGSRTRTFAIGSR